MASLVFLMTGLELISLTSLLRAVASCDASLLLTLTDVLYRLITMKHEPDLSTMR